MADSVCCTAEKADNTVSNYTPIKLKKKSEEKSYHNNTQRENGIGKNPFHRTKSMFKINNSAVI